MEKTGISYQDAYAEWSSGIPMRRMQQPADIAKGVLFLASDAASEITGAALNIQRRSDHPLRDGPRRPPAGNRTQPTWTIADHYREGLIRELKNQRGA